MTFNKRAILVTLCLLVVASHGLDFGVRKRSYENGSFYIEGLQFELSGGDFTFWDEDADDFVHISDDMIADNVEPNKGDCEGLPPISQILGGSASLVCTTDGSAEFSFNTTLDDLNDQVGLGGEESDRRVLRESGRKKHNTVPLKRYLEAKQSRKTHHAHHVVKSVHRPAAKGPATGKRLLDNTIGDEGYGFTDYQLTEEEYWEWLDNEMTLFEYRDSRAHYLDNLYYSGYEWLCYLNKLNAYGCSIDQNAESVLDLLENCDNPHCWSSWWIGDQTCNPECCSAACLWDGGDCSQSGCQADPISMYDTLETSCNPVVDIETELDNKTTYDSEFSCYYDNVLWNINNQINQATNTDWSIADRLRDCPYRECSVGSWIGDNICDQICFTSACLWDGGDCNDNDDGNMGAGMEEEEGVGPSTVEEEGDDHDDHDEGDSMLDCSFVPAWVANLNAGSFNCADQVQGEFASDAEDLSDTFDADLCGCNWTDYFVWGAITDCLCLSDVCGNAFLTGDDLMYFQQDCGYVSSDTLIEDIANDPTVSLYATQVLEPLITAMGGNSSDLVTYLSECENLDSCLYSNWIRDGICDGACSSYACLADGGDCNPDNDHLNPTGPFTPDGLADGWQGNNITYDSSLDAYKFTTPIDEADLTDIPKSNEIAEAAQDNYLESLWDTYLSTLHTDVSDIPMGDFSPDWDGETCESFSCDAYYFVWNGICDCACLNPWCAMSGLGTVSDIENCVDSCSFYFEYYGYDDEYNETDNRPVSEQISDALTYDEGMINQFNEVWFNAFYDLEAAGETEGLGFFDFVDGCPKAECFTGLNIFNGTCDCDCAEHAACLYDAGDCDPDNNPCSGDITDFMFDSLDTYLETAQALEEGYGIVAGDCLSASAGACTWMFDLPTTEGEVDGYCECGCFIEECGYGAEEESDCETQCSFDDDYWNNYDDGDDSFGDSYYTDMYPNCEGVKTAEAPMTWIGDNICDTGLNFEECGFDGGDCPTYDFGECSPGCPKGWIGDGGCDFSCLNNACGFDASEGLEENGNTNSSCYSYDPNDGRGYIVCGDCEGAEGTPGNGFSFDDGVTYDPFWDTMPPEFANDECSPGCWNYSRSDGYCDPSCNNYDCNYDSTDSTCMDESCGDCADSLTDYLDTGDYLPWEQEMVYNCADDCPVEWVGDCYCDDSCNNEECGFDAGDCEAEPICEFATDGIESGSWDDEELYIDDYSYECSPGCPFEYIGDQFCDIDCFNAYCNWDTSIDISATETSEESDCYSYDIFDYASVFDGTYDGGYQGLIDEFGLCNLGCFWDPMEDLPSMGNEFCDPECYNEACFFDFGDCDFEDIFLDDFESYNQTDSFDGCLCSMEELEDDLCQLECYTQECSWDLKTGDNEFPCNGSPDGTDCDAAAVPPCQWWYSEYELECWRESNYECYPWWLSDGICDESCQIDACYNDWGDCDACTGGSSGGSVEEEEGGSSGYDNLQCGGDDYDPSEGQSCIYIESIDFCLPQRLIALPPTSDPWGDWFNYFECAGNMVTPDTSRLSYFLPMSVEVCDFGYKGCTHYPIWQDGRFNVMWSGLPTDETEKMYADDYEDEDSDDSSFSGEKISLLNCSLAMNSSQIANDGTPLDEEFEITEDNFLKQGTSAAKLAEIQGQLEDLLYEIEYSGDIYDLQSIEHRVQMLTHREVVDGALALFYSFFSWMPEKQLFTDTKSCLHDAGTTEYASDPCCNKQLSYFQCCNSKDVFAWTDVVDDVHLDLINEKCGTQATKATSTLIDFMTDLIQRKQNDLAFEDILTEANFNSKVDFVEECYSSVFSPQVECDSDNQCTWSNSCDKGAGACRIPSNPGNALFNCLVSEMSPDVFRHLLRILEVDPAQSDAEIMAEVRASFDTVARTECVGLTADQFTDRCEWDVNTSSEVSYTFDDVTEEQCHADLDCSIASCAHTAFGSEDYSTCYGYQDYYSTWDNELCEDHCNAVGGDGSFCADCYDAEDDSTCYNVAIAPMCLTLKDASGYDSETGLASCATVKRFNAETQQTEEIQTVNDGYNSGCMIPLTKKENGPAQKECHEEAFCPSGSKLEQFSYEEDGEMLTVTTCRPKCLAKGVKNQADCLEKNPAGESSRNDPENSHYWNNDLQKDLKCEVTRFSYSADQCVSNNGAYYSGTEFVQGKYNSQAECTGRCSDGSSSEGECESGNTADADGNSKPNGYCSGCELTRCSSFGSQPTLCYVNKDFTEALCDNVEIENVQVNWKNGLCVAETKTQAQCESINASKGGNFFKWASCTGLSETECGDCSFALEFGSQAWDNASEGSDLYTVMSSSTCPLTNGKVRNLLQCEPDWYVPTTKSECAKCGWCDDWELTNWSNPQANGVCVRNFSLDNDGTPYCQGNTTFLEIGCLDYDKTSQGDCKQVGGEWTKVASTESECKSHWVCDESDRPFPTLKSRDDCTACGGSPRNPYYWYNAQWIGLSWTPFSWKAKELTPVNRMETTYPFWEIYDKVEEAAMREFKINFTNYLQTQYKNFLVSLKKIACYCGGSLSQDDVAECDATLSGAQLDSDLGSFILSASSSDDGAEHTGTFSLNGFTVTINISGDNGDEIDIDVVQSTNSIVNEQSDATYDSRYAQIEDKYNSGDVDVDDKTIELKAKGFNSSGTRDADKELAQGESSEVAAAKRQEAYNSCMTRKEELVNAGSDKADGLDCSTLINDGDSDSASGNRRRRLDESDTCTEYAIAINDEELIVGQIIGRGYTLSSSSDSDETQLACMPIEYEMDDLFDTYDIGYSNDDGLVEVEGLSLTYSSDGSGVTQYYNDESVCAYIELNRTAYPVFRGDNTSETTLCPSNQDTLASSVDAAASSDVDDDEEDSDDENEEDSDAEEDENDSDDEEEEDTNNNNSSSSSDDTGSATSLVVSLTIMLVSAFITLFA